MFVDTIPSTAQPEEGARLLHLEDVISVFPFLFYPRLPMDRTAAASRAYELAKGYYDPAWEHQPYKGIEREKSELSVFIAE